MSQPQIIQDQTTAIGHWGAMWEVSYRIASESFLDWEGFRRFLFRADYSLERHNGWRKCWWPRGVITILGLSIGVGFYLDLGHWEKKQP